MNSGDENRLDTLPGMAELLPALDGLGPVWLVGGAVRDFLAGHDHGADIDIAVEGDALAPARSLADRLGGELVEHDRFGTATVNAGALVIDLAATRRETYERPGALPVVAPAGIEDDLARRDFTVNAMALPLPSGEGVDPHGGRADLERRTLRVLHDQSFVDDPTRLLRLARYAGRLGFGIEDETTALAKAAVQDGALDTVSGDRIGAELLLLLSEADAPAGVRLLGDFGIAAALHPGLAANPELVASAQLGSADTGADRTLAGLAAMATAGIDGLEPWVGGLGLGAGERDRVVRAARRAPELVEALRRQPGPSATFRLLDGEPPEALALALGLGAPGAPVLHYLTELRPVRLEITGDDLVAAGVPPSPAIGRALDATLDRVLDGELATREEQLEAALEAARAQA